MHCLCLRTRPTVYNEASEWEEHRVFIGDSDVQVLFVDINQLSYHSQYPKESINQRRVFEDMEAWLGHALSRGLWTTDDELVNGPFDLSLHSMCSPCM